MLDDADLHSALFAKLQGLVDRERVAQVDMEVGDGEWRLLRGGGLGDWCG
jgi:hypothetical protein